MPTFIRPLAASLSLMLHGAALPAIVTLAAVSPVSAGSPEFPDTPAAMCAKAFLEVANAPTLENIKAFESKWGSKVRQGKASVEDRVESLGRMHADWGALKLDRVSAPTDGPVVLFVTSASGEELAMEFQMSSIEAGRMDSVLIMPASEAAQAKALSPEVRKETVEGVAKELRENYVFPDQGAKMADTILANLKSGAYDSITNEGVLAIRLTDDCRAITNDKHLGIRPSPAPKEARREEANPHEQMRRENWGFKKVEILPGNIGYLRFDFFGEEDEAKAIASSAMNFLAGADAIIFDLRFNGGGSPEMIRYISSYLFESKTHLNDMVDRDSKVVEEYWTMEEVPGRRPRKDVPVFVLTSSRTFSGAEEFSYNLKNLQRGTIVGETTGGGAHPVRGVRVNDRFVVRVPYMRAQNPISKTNWEGTGVEPDVKVAAPEALDRAVELARASAKKLTNADR